MELVCFYELSGLEKVGIIVAVVLGLLFVILGIILAFRPVPSGKSGGSITVRKKSISLQGPLAVIVVGLLLWVGAGWWLCKTFPAESISFSQKAWTLREVKERVERVSGIRVNLKTNAPSFTLDPDKAFSGACATDLLTSICEFYAAELECDCDSEAGVFNISVRQ